MQSAFSSIPCVHPIENGENMHTTINPYSAMNMNPRTLNNYMQAPCGHGRNQISLITNLDLNKPAPLLEVSNREFIRNVMTDRTPVRVPQYKL